MSEPTYRVELVHNPVNEAWPWEAVIYRVADDEYMAARLGVTRQDACENAQSWARAASMEAEARSVVMLTEDGDILDPHEVQR